MTRPKEEEEKGERLSFSFKNKSKSVPLPSSGRVDWDPFISLFLFSPIYCLPSIPLNKGKAARLSPIYTDKDKRMDCFLSRTISWVNWTFTKFLLRFAIRWKCWIRKYGEKCQIPYLNDSIVNQYLPRHVCRTPLTYTLNKDP